MTKLAKLDSSLENDCILGWPKLQLVYFMKTSASYNAMAYPA